MNEHAKVWTLSPTFRAEKSDTPRHVSEFWMLEAEMRTEALSDIMDSVEDMMKQLVERLRPTSIIQELVTLKRRDGIEDTDTSQNIGDLISKRWEAFTKKPWLRITYTEAMCELEAAAVSGAMDFQYSPIWHLGFKHEHERFIAKVIGRGSPIFITDYPQWIKPFYMLPSSNPTHAPNKRPTVACFDLLLPDGCEVVGGSLREHRMDRLSNIRRRHNLKHQGRQGDTASADSSPSTHEDELDWYMDLRRYGTVPHGGYGLGFDRLLGYLAGISSIRDVVAWPRYYGRCDC